MPTSVPTSTNRTPLNTKTSRLPVDRNKTVLVLNSFKLFGSWPVLWSSFIDSNGRLERLDCISYDDKTEAYHSCSLVLNNHLYIFGGENQKRQILKLNQFRIQRVGSLPFDLQHGACTNMGGRKFFLCFDQYDPQRCYWSINPLGNFQNVTLTSFNHSQIKISSSECEFFLSF